jgi:hypothetical protein
MALSGKAALAMWWDIAPETMAEFAHWHAHEHFPERLGIPGFRRASRWTRAAGGEGVFVMYELDDHGVLGSAPYLERLNAPSEWSVRMMPHHRNMVRSQCVVLASAGALASRHALTIRLSPRPERASGLLEEMRSLGERLVGAAGLTGSHVLRHEAPAIAVTEEQRIRGLKDRYADWVVVVTGYDAERLSAVSADLLSDASLVAWGAAPEIERALYTLAYAAVPADVAGIAPAD